MPFRTSHLFRVALPVLCAMAAGCAAPVKPLPAAPAPVVVIPPPPPVDPIAAIVRRVEAQQTRLAQLPAAGLADEIARMRASPATAENSVQLAMALAISRVPGDTVRAQQVLEPLLKPAEIPPVPLLDVQGSSEDDAWRVMARLLAPLLVELRRVEEQGEQSAQQVRDVQKRLDQVNEKLEALRAIERSLGARPAPAPARTLP